MCRPRLPPTLMGLDNVVLLPHATSATQQTRQAVAGCLFNNLHSHFTTGRLLSEAPAPAWTSNQDSP